VVAVMVVSVFGLSGAVHEVVSALCAAGLDVLDEGAGTGSDDRSMLGELAAEWTSAVRPAHVGETDGTQLWWALDDDDIGPLRAAFEPILAAHTVCGREPGTVPADCVAWTVACHRYTGEH
jgi:hypothetical protein